MKVVCTVILAAISLALVTAAVPRGSPFVNENIELVSFDCKRYGIRIGDQVVFAECIGDRVFDPENLQCDLPENVPSCASTETPGDESSTEATLSASDEESNGAPVSPEDSNASTERPIFMRFARSLRRRSRQEPEGSTVEPEPITTTVSPDLNAVKASDIRGFSYDNSNQINRMIGPSFGGSHWVCKSVNINVSDFASFGIYLEPTRAVICINFADGPHFPIPLREGSV